MSSTIPSRTYFFATLKPFFQRCPSRYFLAFHHRPEVLCVKFWTGSFHMASGLTLEIFGGWILGCLVKWVDFIDLIVFLDELSTTT